MYKNQLQILQMPGRHTFELLLGLDITIVTLTSTRYRKEMVFATDWDKTFEYHKYQYIWKPLKRSYLLAL